MFDVEYRLFANDINIKRSSFQRASSKFEITVRDHSSKNWTYLALEQSFYHNKNKLFLFRLLIVRSKYNRIHCFILTINFTLDQFNLFLHLKIRSLAGYFYLNAIAIKCAQIQIYF